MGWAAVAGLGGSVAGAGTGACRESVEVAAAGARASAGAGAGWAGVSAPSGTGFVGAGTGCCGVSGCWPPAATVSASHAHRGAATRREDAARATGRRAKARSMGTLEAHFISNPMVLAVLL